ncbi:hypothetical protein J4402_02330 [Candidatus Pacearchaeota archaeon]|nr:hypothetical protein [uncultured archaeon]AQS31897.1 hypothetical protein [uncultured archaeon]MBS3088595.1 hypothetical protein [Candidatus Pacearchaeota archaeon]
MTTTIGKMTTATQPSRNLKECIANAAVQGVFVDINLTEADDEIYRTSHPDRASELLQFAESRLKSMNQYIEEGRRKLNESTPLQDRTNLEKQSSEYNDHMKSLLAYKEKLSQRQI